MLGREQFVYDVDDAVSTDDIAGYDLSLVIYIYCALKSAKREEKEISIER
jgi:hypothetical protein